VEHDEDTGAVRAGQEDADLTTGGRRTAGGSAGGDVAGPNQDNDGFATGQEDDKPDPPEEGLQPNFARGVADEDSVDTSDEGRFSEGHEAMPDSPEKDVDRRFSEGIEGKLPRKD
jgi:hypothetical protein